MQARAETLRVVNLDPFRVPAVHQAAVRDVSTQTPGRRVNRDGQRWYNAERCHMIHPF